ncbi:MAG: histidine kinase dimerization/phosphoacceptor domain -containing protein [Balneolales bacterium]
MAGPGYALPGQNELLNEFEQDSVQAYVYDRTTGEFWFVPESAGGIDSLLAISGEEMNREQEKAAYAAFQAMEMAERLDYDQGLARANFRLGEIYEMFMDYPQALGQYQSALEMERRLEREVYIGQVLNRIGMVYIKQGENLTARDYLERSAGLMDESSYVLTKAEALLALGKTYYNTGDYQRALEYFNQVRELESDSEEMENVKVSARMMVGNTLMELEEYERAERLLNQAVSYFGEHDKVSEQSEGHLDLAILNRRQGDLDEALDHTRLALILADSIEETSLVLEGHRSLSEIYQAQNNTGQALENYQRYHELYARFHDREREARIAQRQIQHDVAQQRREIWELQQQADLSEAELENQELWRIFLLTGLGFTVILALLLYRNLRIRRAAYSLRTNLSELLEKTQNEIYVFDENTLRFIDVNVGARENLGYSLDELKKMTPLAIKPEYDEESFHHLVQPLKDGTKGKIVFITVHRRADGSLYDVEVHLQLIRQDSLGVFVAIIIDITERVRLEQQLKSSLKEKEVLLNEVHHRVKNNLAIISSLLTLQADTVKDDRLRVLLKESEGRVKTMSVIHEMLYQQEDFSRIAFGPYFARLFKHISDNFKPPDQEITLDLHADDIYLDLNLAIPCALIVNELVTNSFKHAFKGREKGNVTIEFHEKEGEFTLCVKDNGTGFTNGKQQKGASMGTSLIHGLTRQIRGSASINTENGTSTTITFAAHHGETEGLRD